MVNGKFKYIIPMSSTVDDDGFRRKASKEEWVEGIEAKLDKFIPAKVSIGTDGISYSYSYNLFIPKYFKIKLPIGTKILFTDNEGNSEMFTINGVDQMNKRYYEVWG